MKKILVKLAQPEILTFLLPVVGLALSLLSYFLGKLVFARFLRKLIKKTKNELDDLILEAKLDHLLCLFLPGIVLYFCACPFYEGYLEAILKRASFAYIVLLSSLVINKILTILVLCSQKIESFKDKPIKSYIQTVKIFLFLFTGIIFFSVLLHKSPNSFLGGIGALTAILVLIFRDPILGFVASVQIATNNLIRLGDWIEVPKYSADGEVIDISLSTVKVQNWDKTIVNLPTYGLVSDSFKNWRGMSESGGRRIKRAIKLDLTSIKFCDQALLKKLEKIELLKDLLRKKNQEIKEYNQKKQKKQENQENQENQKSPRQLTNIGVFRLYLEEYLKNNQEINQTMTFIIRQLAPSREGLPLEIYVFSKKQDWADYERVQADIFDHFLAIIPDFELKVFQDPSSYDLKSLISIK